MVFKCWFRETINEQEKKLGIKVWSRTRREGKFPAGEANLSEVAHAPRRGPKVGGAQLGSKLGKGSPSSNFP
jgi:hypothetical protein